MPFPRPILLTSFATWLPHQRSNSSDDLVAEVLARLPQPHRFQTLRQLPVCFEQAPALVLAQIAALQPELVLCCGMAEGRSQLCLEAQAVWADQMRSTPLPLASLLTGLSTTAISHDAGQFVCNRLYFAVLDYLQQSSRASALFVHVPLLQADNREAIVADFLTLLQRLQSSHNDSL